MLSSLSSLRRLARDLGAVGPRIGMAWLSPLACGDAGTAPPEREESAPAQEGLHEHATSGTEQAAPAARLSPGAAGCAGTCQQVCDCLAAACQRDGAGSCGSRAEECRAGCERSTCSAGEPACWGTLPGTLPLPPDDPEPEPPRPGPGPEPDPSPVDAPGSSSAPRRSYGY